jgi:hypothetical protein
MMVPCIAHNVFMYNIVRFCVLIRYCYFKSQNEVTVMMCFLATIAGYGFDKF